MNLLNTIENIAHTKLYEAGLKYCFVDDNKLPHRIDGSLARPNDTNDFVNFDTLLQHYSDEYAGVGISIQASNVFGIDVDHCFLTPFDIDSMDDRAKDILRRFKSIAYCEFSFSGTGLRILFKMNKIDNYTKSYYIKNSKNNIEFYQPSSSFRYVTITGKSIYDNLILDISENKSIVYDFLETYMKKPVDTKIRSYSSDERSIDELMKLTKFLYLKNSIFQNLWFSQAPGAGKNESEKDFQLIALLFENITTDKVKLKTIFELSPYFKSKDAQHLNKWNYGNFRYYEYIYTHL